MACGINAGSSIISTHPLAIALAGIMLKLVVAGFCHYRSTFCFDEPGTLGAIRTKTGENYCYGFFAGIYGKGCKKGIDGKWGIG